MKGKLLFIHVPKTAGTSLKYSLADGLGYEKFFFASIRDQILQVVNAAPEFIQKYDFIGGHITIGMYETLMSKFPEHEYYVFSCLREPHRRLFSLCNYYASGMEKDFASFSTMDYAQQLMVLENNVSLLPMTAWIGSTLNGDRTIEKAKLLNIRLYPIELAYDLMLSRLSAFFNTKLVISTYNYAKYAQANFGNFLEALNERKKLKEILREDVQLYNYSLAQYEYLLAEEPVP